MSARPRFTRAAVFRGVGQPVEVCDLPIPALQSSDVLVHLLACTICGSDVHSFSGRREVAVPTILGHEILGRIVEFGPAAPRRDASGAALSVGDRVTWAIVANCGECFYCRRGLPQKCLKGVKYGHERLGPGRELVGGLAEHCVLVPGTAIFRVPDELPDEIACPANCATATVAAVLESAGNVENRAILILGAGMLGLTACAMARSLGAAEVVCCDLDPSRIERAIAFGATHVATPADLPSVVSSVNAGFGVDCGLELSGSPAAFDAAMSHLRLGGRLVLAGAVFPTPAVALSMEQVVRRHLAIVGVHNYAPKHLQAALDFLRQSTAYPFASLVSSWYPLSAAAAALQEASAHRAPRVGVRSDA